MNTSIAVTDVNTNLLETAGFEVARNHAHIHAISCPSCGGSGSWICGSCGGSGKMNPADPYSLSCSFCGGDGRVNCETCGGNGQV